MLTTPAFTPPRPGATAARWRGPLVLAPVVVALHAAVLFSAWQVVDRQPALPQATARDADTAGVVLQPAQMLVQTPVQTPVQPRELRLVAHTPMEGAAGADAPMPVMAPVPAPMTPAVTAQAQASAPSTAAAAAATQAKTAPAPPPPRATTPLAMPTPEAAVTAAATTPTPAAALVTSAAPTARTPPAAPTAAGLDATSMATAQADTAPPTPDPTPDATPQARLTPLAADALAPAAVSSSPRPPPAAAAGSASGGMPSLPVYRGEPPPPATLHFTLRRAAISGRGQLVWKHSAQGYELTLQGTVLGLRALEQTSRGRFDQGSLAPDRFLDSRRGRAARAANFRRDVGLISYSAVEQTYPLVRGAQDRLSWMLHLPAVMQANPALRQVGTELHMFVTGARGDGDVWGFRVISVDRLSLPVGDVPRALHLQRLPRHEHDTQADIWLDPEQHHLPARVRLQSGDDVLDLVLERREGG